MTLHEAKGGREFPKHFDGARFYNPNFAEAPGLLGVLRWKMTSRAEKSPRFISDVKTSIPPQQVAEGELRATVVNHSTVLIQERTSHILTDPIWSKRSSPFSWIGPARRRSPGVEQADIPRVDVVLISHNHVDHLDLPTLRWLATRGDTRFVVPVGVSALLRSQRIGPVDELDWGQSVQMDSATIHSVPAFHFSARGPFDRNKTLWCGYVIEYKDHRIYFAGDTGFGEHFAWIRERFGSPSLSLLPIGAYLPKRIMSPIHMGPAEAIKAHEILCSEASIAIHHGTFQLADDGIDTPKRELMAASKPESFLILENGQSFGVQR